MYIEQAREAKLENPHVKYGRWLTNTGIGITTAGILFSISINIPKFQFVLKIDTGAEWIIAAFGIVLTIVGIVITSKGLSTVKNNWQEKKFYYLKGLDKQTIDIPFQALPKIATLYRPSPILLTIKNDNLDIMFNDLEHAKRIIEDRNEQYGTKDIFFAGIARVPCLFFIGYSFRNGHSDSITLIENSHEDGWFKLTKIDEPNIDITIQSIGWNLDKIVSDIAVTIEFTSEIMINELPLYLQESITKIQPTVPQIHNLIKSEKALKRIVEKIVNHLVQLSKRCNRLHLFISAQSSIVFELGRRYQDGMIGNITIYQYVPPRKGYPWAISLTNGQLKLEDVE
jgi:hypothetical protein